jgi:hypothetical protein
VSDSKDYEGIPSRYGVITIRPAGGQPLAGLSAARGLAPGLAQGLARGLAARRA